MARTQKATDWKSTQLQYLVEQAEGLGASATPAVLRALMGRTGVTLADVADFIEFDTAGYARSTVYASEQVEVLVLGWLRGQASAVHNHTGSTCAVKVLKGIASEMRFEPVDAAGGPPKPIGFKRHVEGDVLAMAGADTHRIANLDRGPLVTLHVYAPPLNATRVQTQRDDERPQEPGDGPDRGPNHGADSGAGGPDSADGPDPQAGNEASGGKAPHQFEDRAGDWHGEDLEPDIRDQVSARLRRLGVPGRLLDRFVTFVSSIAPSDAEPWFIWRRWSFYTAALAWLLGGAAASAGLLLAMPTMPVWLLPAALLGLVVSMMATAAGGRAVQITLMHDAVHGWDVANKAGDATARALWWAAGTAQSALLFVQNFEGYRDDHLEHHDEDTFATVRDPDVRFLRYLGFEPGQSPEALEWRYRKLVRSPWFHGVFLAKRLLAQLTTGPIWRRVVVVAAWAAVLALLAANGLLLVFALAWALPLTVLFQRNALRQYVTEHRWLKVEQPDAQTGQPPAFAEVSAGRFALDAPPAENMRGVRKLLAWATWWRRLLLVHAPFRAQVVWGDLSHHDMHHDHGLERLAERGVELPRYAQPDIAWMNTAYARRTYEKLRQPGDPKLAAFWNEADARRATFEGLAAIDPATLPADDGGDKGSGMLGM
ncbi:MAG: fatty acid desaturase [Phycisphaerales bacterium]